MSQNPEPTRWEVPDDIRAIIKAILDEVYPRKPTGHRRVDLRRGFNGIICRSRSGCQWKQLPTTVGDDRPVHRHFQTWCKLGVFERPWTVLVQACDELGGVDWPWQSADAMRGKARIGWTWLATIGRIAATRGENTASGSMLTEVRLAALSLEPTSTTPSSGQRPSRPSSSSAHSQPQSIRSIGAWTKATLIPQAAWDYHDKPHIRRIGEGTVDENR